MKEIRIFEGVSEGDIKFILSKCDIEIFTKYDKIMTQGEDSNGKGYIIKSGFVSIERN
jgi:signal-transduction protein with cAMP-binding, CBS, and nucleotidyltransferase domain